MRVSQDLLCLLAAMLRVHLTWVMQHLPQDHLTLKQELARLKAERLAKRAEMEEAAKKS